MIINENELSAVAVTYTNVTMPKMSGNALTDKTQYEAGYLAVIDAINSVCVSRYPYLNKYLDGIKSSLAKLKALAFDDLYLKPYDAEIYEAVKGTELEAYYTNRDEFKTALTKLIATLDGVASTPIDLKKIISDVVKKNIPSNQLYGLKVELVLKDGKIDNVRFSIQTVGSFMTFLGANSTTLNYLDQIVAKMVSYTATLSTSLETTYADGDNAVNKYVASYNNLIKNKAVMYAYINTKKVTVKDDKTGNVAILDKTATTTAIATEQKKKTDTTAVIIGALLGATALLLS